MPNTRIHLSANGPEFSRIALGLWRLDSWQLSTAKRLDFLQQAIALGITTIDHADIYGSEAPFGEALALAPSLRTKIEIITKCGIVWRDEKSLLRVTHYDTSRAHIIASLENSLRLLGTDYVDLLLIHRPDPLMQADEIAEAFQLLQRAGKVRHFGVSNFTPAQFDLLASRHKLTTNQIELSPLHLDSLHDGTLDQCQRLSISPIIWSALGGGRVFNEHSPRAERLRVTLAALGAEYGVSATTIVYAWLLQHPSKPVVLTGSGRVFALREAVAAIGLTLTREHWFAVWCASTGTAVP
ncbi:aldo/keto reductase [Solimicrobium silvestre]|uniref:Putative oxidoreductase n=1 Tax=Solimicrobium silvestre TaxID=2099400 RepID=A0A2S9H3U2_9BURK|nr:aldo/keto reductase [Solimicrobium silvestre]PRC94649.1 putative oxidoreductase [Solimicrobium silvestre]